MKYICFTNNELLASSLDNLNPVDTIFIDLEKLGKDKRQGHTNSLISNHTYQDILNIRKSVRSSFLGVRIDPLNENTEFQVNKVIQNGADVIMLPMFSNIEEVKETISIINKRVYLDLLFETPKSLDLVDLIPKNLVRKIHFGINDLALAYSFNSMFSCLFSKAVISAAFRAFKRNIEFGLGGLGSLGSKPINPELIMAKLIQMKANRAILSRSFLKDIDISDFKSAKESAEKKLNELIEVENKLNSLCSDRLQIYIDELESKIKIISQEK